MSVEKRREYEEFGALDGCFVGGDEQQRKRERRVKRRALAISVALQALALAAVILLPLFGRGERIALAYATPIPPYSPHAPRQPRPTNLNRPVAPNPCRFCFSKIPQGIVIRDRQTTNSDGPETPLDFNGLTAGPVDPHGIPIMDTRSRPAPPPPPHDTPRIVHVTQLDPATLMRRVEPVYPTLAKQTHREGRVELHAIIGTDGTIQSLQ